MEHKVNLMFARRGIYLVVTIVFIAAIVVLLQLFRSESKDHSMSSDLATRSLATNFKAAAERAIQPPKLMDGSVERSVTKAELSNEIKRIDELAVQCGGSATQGLEPANKAGIVMLLARVPQQNKETFLAVAQDQSKTTSLPSPSQTLSYVFIDIRIRVTGGVPHPVQKQEVQSSE
jgi:hypothetical protein